MIAKVGGKQKVNEFLRASGYQVLRQNKTALGAFRHTFESLDPKYRSLQPEDVLGHVARLVVDYFDGKR
jgi:hypothetical protein